MVGKSRYSLVKIGKFEPIRTYYASKMARYQYDLYKNENNNKYVIFVTDNNEKKLFWKEVLPFVIDTKLNKVISKLLNANENEVGSMALRNQVMCTMKLEIRSNEQIKKGEIIANELVKYYNDHVESLTLCNDIEERRFEILSNDAVVSNSLIGSQYTMDMDNLVHSCHVKATREFYKDIVTHIHENESSICDNETSNLRNVFIYDMNNIFCRHIKEVKKLSESEAVITFELGIKNTAPIKADDEKDKDKDKDKCTKKRRIYYGGVIKDTGCLYFWRVSKITRVLEFKTFQSTEELYKSDMYDPEIISKASLIELIDRKCKLSYNYDKRQLEIIKVISNKCESGKYTIDRVLRMINIGEIQLKVKEVASNRISSKFRIERVAYIMKPSQSGRNMNIEVTFRYGTTFNEIRYIIRRRLYELYLDIQDEYEKSTVNDKYKFKNFKLVDIKYLEGSGLMFMFRLSNEVKLDRQDLITLGRKFRQEDKAC